MISYEHFAGLNCQETSVNSLCQTTFYLNYLKSGLFAFLTVISGLYQRSIAKEINVARARHFSQGFFSSISPAQPLETVHYGPQIQQVPAVLTFRPAQPPAPIEQQTFFCPRIP